MTDHTNICVIAEECSEGITYSLNNCQAFRALCIMRSRKTAIAWTCLVGVKSIAIIEMLYNAQVWKKLWCYITKYYDCAKPNYLKSVTEIKSDLNRILTDYLQSNVDVLCEVPRMEGTSSNLEVTEKFSAYHFPTSIQDANENVMFEGNFQDFCFECADHVEEGINFLRIEANEILAFVATDYQQTYKSGIPPHLPIAYGLRGPSVPNAVMQNIVNDIRDELEFNDTTVLCEVYDGQFHKLIVESEDGWLLMHLQHATKHFNETLQNNDKEDLLEFIMNYSTISGSDITDIENTCFRSGKKMEFESVSLSMECVLQGQVFIRKMSIETIPVGDFQMKDMVTRHWKVIWHKFLSEHKMRDANVDTALSTEELKTLFTGSKIHRRLLSHTHINVESENSDSDSDDPDYVPTNEAESTDDSQSESENMEENIHNLSTVSTGSVGDSCMKKIMLQLRKFNNKHRWHNESVDTLIQKYLSSHKNIEKLFMYKLDAICKVVKEDFGKLLFKPGDKKTTRVNKIHQQLKQMPQLLQYSTRDEEFTEIFQPKSLKQTYMDFILKSNYPKEYLAAPVAEITHFESVKEWESKSGIQINLDIPGIEHGHIIFNYPEYSMKRKQLEMRTFDYTHILNNLHYHICSKGLEGIKTSAFIAVSNVNHDVLPHAIVKDKMDRQNCTISQRFFSSDV